MVIPRGKKFRFYSSANSTGGLLPGEMPKGDAFSIPNINKFAVPPIGYTGNSYLTQDLSLAFSAEYSNPFEGIFGSIPNTVDFVGQAVTGKSIKASKVAAIKYWNNTNPLEVDLAVTFETQIDSFYDVFLPVFYLLLMVLPGESEDGFFIPPTATVKSVADQVLNFVQGLPNVSGRLAGVPFDTGVAKKGLVGMLTDAIGKIVVTGYTTHLFVGESMWFENVMIKSINPVFSTDYCYAPIYSTLNNKTHPATVYNPYSSSEFVNKAMSQSLMAAVAGVNNAISGFSSVVNSFLAGADDGLLTPTDMAAFPVKCDVNISLELQFPVSKTSLSKVLSPLGGFSPIGLKQINQQFKG